MATATQNAARNAAKALNARKAKTKALKDTSPKDVSVGPKRLDLSDLRKKYKKIKFVDDSLRFVKNPKSHFHNKQVVDVVCKDNNKNRTLATSDLQHYKDGALSEDGARERRLANVRARRQAAKA